MKRKYVMKVFLASVIGILSSLPGLSASATDELYTDSTTGMVFVYVPGGCFLMGDRFEEGESDEKPVHEVCVDGFYMGKYEVTQGEYVKLMGNNTSYPPKRNRNPVQNVNWNEAQAFITKLNSKSGLTFRLPTEAEWEYAAREGGKMVRFGTGKDTISPDEANFCSIEAYKESYSKTGKWRGEAVAVGSFQPNALGLFDMSGNVEEWCSDLDAENYYKFSPRQNPMGSSTGWERIVRGGSWDSSPRILRVANRVNVKPSLAGGGRGFRLVFPVQRP